MKVSDASVRLAQVEAQVRRLKAERTATLMDRWGDYELRLARAEVARLERQVAADRAAAMDAHPAGGA